MTASSQPLSPREIAVMQELADLKAGIPSHKHIGTDGHEWRCTSPYCERGGDLRDDPEPAPGQPAASAEKYRRDYA